MIQATTQDPFAPWMLTDQPMGAASDDQEVVFEVHLSEISAPGSREQNRDVVSNVRAACAGYALREYRKGAAWR